MSQLGNKSSLAGTIIDASFSHGRVEMADETVGTADGQVRDDAAQLVNTHIAATAAAATATTVLGDESSLDSTPLPANVDPIPCASKTVSRDDIDNLATDGRGGRPDHASTGSITQIESSKEAGIL